MWNCCSTEENSTTGVVGLADTTAGGFISAEFEVLVERIRSVVLVPVFFLIGGPANLINLGVFYSQGFGQRINVALFSLAAVDLVYLTSVLVLHWERVVSQFTTQERYGPLFRQLIDVNFIGLYGFLYASVFLYTIIACERCLCVVLPMQSKRVLKTRVMAVICITGVVVIAFLRFVITARLVVVCRPTGAGNETSCAFGMTEFGKKHRDLIRILDSTLYGFILTVGCPLTVAVTTAITTAELYRAMRWREDAARSTPRRELALTKTLITLSVVFFALIVPAMAQRILPLFVQGFDATGRYRNEFSVTRTAVSVCSCANSSVNFFVYFFTSTKYKDTLRQMLGRNAVKTVSVSGKVSLADARIKQRPDVSE